MTRLSFRLVERRRGALALALVLLTAGAADATPLFTTPFLSYDTGSFPSSVAIGDLNADGIPDLAIANEFSLTISVLLGAGAGDFGSRVDYSTPTQPYCVKLADLNGDGKLDMVSANWSSATVSVWLGAGNGVLGPRTDIATASNPFSVAVADLNGDTKPDLATGNDSPNSMSVL